MQDYHQLNDEELLLLLRESADQSAFLEIYERYHVGLYTAAVKRCCSAEAAEELVQDLFVRLWKNRETIEIYATLSGYLFTGIRNAVLNYLQHEAVRKNIRIVSEIQDRFTDNSTEELLLANDLNKYIQQKIKALPEKCRSVFELSRLNHKSNKQIASELGLAEKTVENHITRAIKFLRIGMQHLLFILLFLKL